MITLAGTAFVANGAAAVTGIGSTYIGSVFAGDTVSWDRKSWYNVAADASNDLALTLTQNFAETTINTPGSVLYLLPTASTRLTNVGWAVGITELLQRQREAFTLTGNDRRLTLNKASSANYAETLFQDANASLGSVGLSGDDLMSVKQYINNGVATDMIKAVVTGSSPSQVLGCTIVPITKASATAFVVGPNGATNPTLQVDTSTVSAATGVKITAAAAAAGVAIAVISSGTNENLTINAKGSGTISLGTVSTGTLAVGVAAAITSASASALAVGLAGATNPALQVDASTASSATGIKIKSAAAAAGVALSVISSGTNENLTIDAKGSGTLTIGGVSTGAITLARPTAITGTVNASGGYVGVATNTAAAAGCIGEAIVGSGSNITLSNGVATNGASVALTPGDWDLFGSISFSGGATTTLFIINGSISATSGTHDATTIENQSYGTSGGIANFFNSVNNNPAFGVPTKRVSVASNTTYYLVGSAVFSTSTCAIASATLTARRRS